MATATYNIGSGYRILFGNLFQKNDLEINGNGSHATVVIESTSINNFNIPTTLFGTVDGRRAFDAALIDKGVRFAGTTGNETFDASKYYNDVKFNGGAGVNTLKGAHGANIFTHDYVNGGTDTIVGGKTETINWKLFWLNYSKTYKATNDLVVNGTNNADIFRVVGDSNDAVNVFDTLRGSTAPARIKATELGSDAKIQLNGEGGNDTADLRAFKGTAEFNGGAGEDLLQFQHGTSGAGSQYNGGADRDSLQVFAQAAGSTLKLTNTALTDEGAAGKTLLTLNSVDVGSFNGGAGNDTFNASAFNGQVVTNLGAGKNVFHSSQANSNLVTRTLSNDGQDTIYGNLSYTTNLRVQGRDSSDNVTFISRAGDNNFVVKDGSTNVIEAKAVRGTFTVSGGKGDDVLNVREFKQAVTFDGGEGNDKLLFVHGVSAAGSTFKGGDGIDELAVKAPDADTASKLKLTDVALADVAGSNKTLVTLESVEKLTVNSTNSKGFKIDVTEAKNVALSLNGGDQNDTVVFQHGVSAQAYFADSSTGDNDAFILKAKADGSKILLEPTKVKDQGDGNAVLATLKNVENVTFEGSASVDTFNASTFNGKVILNGGAGNDILKAGSGGSEIIGGAGADQIALGSGVDKVFIANRAETRTSLSGNDRSAETLDSITGFTSGSDKIVLGTETSAFGSTLDFDGSTTVNLVDGPKLTIGANVPGNVASWNTVLWNLNNGIAYKLSTGSTDSVVQALQLDIVSNGVGNDIDGKFLFIDNGNGTWDINDTIVKLTGTLSATDFEFGIFA